MEASETPLSPGQKAARSRDLKKKLHVAMLEHEATRFKFDRWLTRLYRATKKVHNYQQAMKRVTRQICELEEALNK